jgi:hypothetical protein
MKATNSFRKTTQFLAPATHSSPDGVFNIYPGQPIGSGRIELGFLALARRIVQHDHVVLDGMGGVMWEDLRARLTLALAEIGVVFEWIDVSEALRPEPEIEQLVAPFLGGDDPVFGTRSTLALRDFFAADKLALLGQRANTDKRTILYGTGAAVATRSGFLIYVDVPKNEIQFRSRAHTVTNLGVRQSAAPKQMYKRFYFVDWPALRRHQAELLPQLDLMLDSQRPDEPVLMSGEDLRAGLAKAGHSWFRARPWFEPGPWGGAMDEATVSRFRAGHSQSGVVI